MTDELRAKLGRLEAVAAKMNHASDLATEAVKAVEARLAEIGIGLSAETHEFRVGDGATMPGDDFGKIRLCSYRLVYGRLNGDFQIYVDQSFHGDEEDVRRARADIERAVADGDTDDPDGILEDDDLDGNLRVGYHAMPWSSWPRAVKIVAASLLPALVDSLLLKAEDTGRRIDDLAAGIAETVKMFGPPAAGPATDRPKAKAAAPPPVRASSRRRTG